MKIVIDSAIPFVRGLFEPYAEVLYLDGASITREDLMDADALMVRTRTHCNKDLLEGTAVRIIATATIGTDHIDSVYCKEKSIFVTNAAGANAGGVMNYVFSALFGAAARRTIKLEGATMGIIGAGHTGTRVGQAARYFGIKVLRCDPPRAEAEGYGSYCTLDTLLKESDIVSLHLPLKNDTVKMCDWGFFDRMKPGAIFINTAHGDLVDEDALMDAISKLGPVIIDTWSGEPHINLKLLDMVAVATPHIAGYSYQGKQNSSTAAVRSIARFFSIRELYEYFPEVEVSEMESIKLDLKGKNQGETASVLQYNYPVFSDDFLFRLDPSGFEKIRASYKYRREFYLDY